MAWNISILTTTGTKEVVDKIIPDIFYKAKESLHFEDATSCSIDKNLTIGYYQNQIIIIDVLGRLVNDEKFAIQVSLQKDESKIFWISESPIYRQYKNGTKIYDINGKQQISNRLKELALVPVDEWGETMIFQLFDFEVFKEKRNDYGMLISNINFDLYELG